MLQVGSEGAANVLPWGEGSGEAEFESVLDVTDDEIICVDVAREPVVTACAVFQLDGYVVERLVERAIHAAQVEADAELDVLLWYLHQSLLALKPEG